MKEALGIYQDMEALFPNATHILIEEGESYFTLLRSPELRNQSDDQSKTFKLPTTNEETL
jgi:hypothetical protein